MRFVLGTHKPHWLRKAAVVLMVSRRRLNERVELPRAVVSWVLDSGAFTELSMYGLAQVRSALGKPNQLPMVAA